MNELTKIYSTIDPSKWYRSKHQQVRLNKFVIWAAEKSRTIINWETAFFRLVVAYSRRYLQLVYVSLSSNNRLHSIQNHFQTTKATMQLSPTTEILQLEQEMEDGNQYLHDNNSLIAIITKS